jgi:hypothetical protein
MVKAVTKSFITHRAVKEYQYEQNQNKYEALLHKAEVLGEGDKQKIHIVVPKENAIDTLGVDQLKNMGPKEVIEYKVPKEKGTSGINRSDNFESSNTPEQKIEFSKNKENAIDTLGVDQLKNMGKKEVAEREVPQEKESPKIILTDKFESSNTPEQKAELRKNNEAVRKELEKEREQRAQNNQNNQQQT